MLKRKRQNLEDDDTQSRDHATLDLLRAQFGKGLKDITAALKLARGFERQKLGRRQKQASKEPHKLLRLREEVITIKQLDLEETAKNYLIKRLFKVKRLRESDAFIKVFGSQPKTTAGSSAAEANILARLFKADAVKKAVKRSTDDVYAVLGLQHGPSTQNVSGAIVSRDDKQSEALSAEEPKKNEFEGRPEVTLQSGDPAESEEDNADSDDMSDSENSDMGESTRPSATAFLPSLGMTGYYSGSDSDASDADLLQEQPRKNRRGQRARQQLAELKYGKNAKHLQKPTRKGDKNIGWDAKRGAIDSVGRRGNTSVGGLGRRSIEATESQRKKPAIGMKDDSGPIHPSWQAAKQRKQQPDKSASYSGTKITFD